MLIYLVIFEFQIPNHLVILSLWRPMVRDALICHCNYFVTQSYNRIFVMVLAAHLRQWYHYLPLMICYSFLSLSCFFFGGGGGWVGWQADHKFYVKIFPNGFRTCIGEKCGLDPALQHILHMWIYFHFMGPLIFLRSDCPTLNNWLVVFAFSIYTRPKWCWADIFFGRVFRTCKLSSPARVH